MATVGLGFIAFLFLVIEGAALTMGWVLARSITGSVHALFQGTERLRLGDLGHRIPIRSRDQLGELAESFNAMTANIETLLEQAAEKRRMEEELRIAREIQMSLLPRHAAPMPGSSWRRSVSGARVGGTTTTSSRSDRAGSVCWWPTWRARGRRPLSTWRS